jgi:hypothetical protein
MSLRTDVSTLYCLGATVYYDWFYRAPLYSQRDCSQRFLLQELIIPLTLLTLDTSHLRLLVVGRHRD